MRGVEVVIFQFDDVQVDVGNAQILKAGRPVAVEPKALRVLVYLLENSGRLVEKEELLAAVWQDTFVTENALTREIALLRKALGDTKSAAKYIETVPTRGYRFIASVTSDGSGEPAGTPAGRVSPGRVAAWRAWKLAWVIVTAALVVMAAGGLALHRWMSRSRPLSL